MIDRIDVSEDSLSFVCLNCGRDNSAAISTLNLGVSIGDVVNPDAVVLGNCQCRAQTVVYRTWDTDEALTTPSRRAINGLAEHLKATGKSHKDAKKIHDDEKRDGKTPAFKIDVSAGVVDDLTSRKQAVRDEQARAEALAELQRREQEKAAARAAEEQAARDAEAARVEALLQLAEQRRRAHVEARVNKRLGREPGTEVTAEEYVVEDALLSAELSDRNNGGRDVSPPTPDNG